MVIDTKKYLLIILKLDPEDRNRVGSNAVFAARAGIRRNTSQNIKNANRDCVCEHSRNGIRIL